MRTFKIFHGSLSEVCDHIVDTLRPHIPKNIEDSVSSQYWSERLGWLDDRTRNKLYSFKDTLSVYMIRYSDNTFSVKVTIPDSPS